MLRSLLNPVFESVSAEDAVTVQDSQTDPSENGEIRRNGTTLKAYTDGSVVSLGGGGGATYPRQINADTPPINLLDGSAFRISHPFSVPAGGTIEAFEAGVADETGSTYTNLTVELYNISTGAVEYSTNSEYAYGEPLSSVSVGGDTVVVRINNQTGSDRSVTGSLDANLVV